MHHFSVWLTAASFICSTFAETSLSSLNSRENRRAFPRRKASAIENTPSRLFARGEPNTGDDLPDTEPHPNNLDKVETAINDALELTSYVKNFIDTFPDIYSHYFNDGDKDEIKRIFTSINNNDNGNDMLDNILIQTTDRDGLCSSQTLAYSGDFNTDTPFIVLCPNAFNKKAVTSLNGVESDDPNSLDYYAACEEQGGQIGDHVSYNMNTLGMTLLHEYMHYDNMIQSSFGSIVDDPDGSPGYGPVNVYDNLDKSKARINADSYAYYASHVLWSVLCSGTDFQAPRPGTDDNDPDCGGQVCHP